MGDLAVLRDGKRDLWPVTCFGVIRGPLRFQTSAPKGCFQALQRFIRRFATVL